MSNKEIELKDMWDSTLKTSSKLKDEKPKFEKFEIGSEPNNYVKKKTMKNRTNNFKKYVGNKYDTTKKYLEQKYDNAGKKYEKLKTNFGPKANSMIRSIKNKKEFLGQKYDDTKEYLGKKYEKTKGYLGNKYEKTKGYLGNKYEKTKEYLGNKYEKTKEYLGPEKNININIKKIKELKGLIKNDCIYIDITNLIGYNYIFTSNISNIFKNDLLLKTIVYMLSSNSNEDKNRIVYFTKYDSNLNSTYLYVYNVREKIQYKPITI